MARANRARKAVPDPPDLPDTFDAPPGDLASRAAWDCVRADASVAVPERLADVTLTECELTGVDLSARQITGLRCRDVVFENCDLSGARLDGAELRRVRLVGCRLTGVVLSGSTVEDVLVEASIANFANFRAMRASFLRADRTTLREADFYTAELDDCALIDCDLAAASFEQARVPGLALHGSTLDGIQGALSLVGVRIDPGQLLPLGVALATAMRVEVGER